MGEITKKILNIPGQYIFLLVLIVQSLCVLVPSAFLTPVTPGPTTIGAYELLESLEKNDVVLVWDSLGWGGYPIPMAAHHSVLYEHLFALVEEIGIKVVVIAGSPTAVVMEKTLQYPKIDFHDAVYGEDWCHLGFYVGGETVMAALFTDLRSVVVADLYGTPIDDLPILEGINTAVDFEICAFVGTNPDSVFRQYYPLNPGPPTHFWMTCRSAWANTFQPYVEAGMLTMVNDVKGATEYEVLLRWRGITFPGLGMSSITMMNSTHVLVIVLIAISNVVYFYDKLKR